MRSRPETGLPHREMPAGRETCRERDVLRLQTTGTWPLYVASCLFLVSLKATKLVLELSIFALSKLAEAKWRKNQMLTNTRSDSVRLCHKAFSDDRPKCTGMWGVTTRDVYARICEPHKVHSTEGPQNQLCSARTTRPGDSKLNLHSNHHHPPSLGPVAHWACSAVDASRGHLDVQVFVLPRDMHIHYGKPL